MTSCPGTRKADFVQRYADRHLATHGRNQSRCSRVLHVDGMADGRAHRATQIHLRGNSCALSSSLCSRARRTGRMQLFENQSVVEYWENFASHAFENTTKAVYSHCVLLKPSGAPLPATFCFSIKRDIFDLPSIVIGGSRFVALARALTSGPRSMATAAIAVPGFLAPFSLFLVVSHVVRHYLSRSLSLCVDHLDHWFPTTNFNAFPFFFLGSANLSIYYYVLVSLHRPRCGNSP